MKRKFKIIFAIVAVMAMLFAFAISSSASTYVDWNDFDFTGNPSSSPNIYTNELSNGSFESSSPESFGFFTLYSSSGGEAYGLVNVEFWDSLIVQYDIKNSSEWVSVLIPKLAELGYVDSEHYAWSYEALINSEFLYASYLDWKQEQSLYFTQSDLDAKYNEGVEAGKAEGKTEGYTEGFAEGIESFKESEAYANALQVQYATGKTDGVTEFKKSVAFKNTLKGEYDNGYDAGVADTEGQVVKNEFTKVLSIFIGVMGFGIILMSVLGVTSKFKKKVKHR